MAQPPMYWFIMAPKTNPPFGGGNRHLLSLRCNTLLGGGFKYCLFSPLLGEDELILTNIFQMG